MDQIKIGKFIASERKRKKYTQKNLADILGISDKTVSKWECGNGFPDVSLLLPLCSELEISVNELLSGERLVQANLERKTEEVIMDLIKEKQESKKKILISIISCTLTLISSVTIILMAGLLQMETWQRVLLIAIGLIVMVGGIVVAAVIDMGAGTFECKYCKTRFVPDAGAYIAGAHSITTRYLKCPECGKKSYCKRRLTH